jgi:hypothetical protein
VNGIANQRDRMARVSSDQFNRDQYECCNNGDTQDAGHALHRQVNMGMPAQAVAVAMLVGSMIMTMGMDVHV